VIFPGQTLEMNLSMEKGKQILIIDDSNTALLLMEYALKEAGFGAIVASSVKEGMAEISRKKPDLILLDLSMPDMSGYDFLKMKESLNIEDVPVIVVSAYDSAESIEMTRQLGAADFIAKPIRLDALMERIHAVLS
jgi:DNA-binding response OmpR family regulator